MQNRKRSIQIIVLVTEQERQLITEKMKQLPTQNLAAYARKMLIDGYIILLDTQEIKAHSAQLQKIGSNINQIARRLNETEMQQEVDTYEQDKADFNSFSAVVRKYVGIKELTPTIVNEFIKRIVVHAPDKSSGKRVQKVDIV